MTPAQILARLKTIGQMSHDGLDRGKCDPTRSSGWLLSDLLDQDALVAIQEEIAQLMLDIANGSGPRAVKQLVRTFPYLYVTTGA